MVARLNAKADGETTRPAEYGTIAWAVARYLGSDKFTQRSEMTRRIYRRWCNEFLILWGDLPCKAISLEVVEQFEEGPLFAGASASKRRQARSALSNVLRNAARHGLIAENPVRKLDELTGDAPRTEYWLPEHETAFLAACDRHEHGDIVRLVFFLLLYTGQRVGDVLGLGWNDYQGGHIRLTQQKTGTEVEVLAHRALQAVLANEPRVSTLIVPLRGKLDLRYERLRKIWNEVQASAGIKGLRRHDLRRTAVVRMSEAGVTVPQIAAVTGHSLDGTKSIIETYLVRTKKQATAAIRRWESDAS